MNTSTASSPHVDFKHFCATRGDGFYADPRDCHAYFHCANNLTFRKVCGAGAAYTNDLPGCIYENQVQECRTHK
ncbi:hypothetical protein ScPMuIL_004844 [Solemya velum]